jgi:hypothetical protein
MKHHVGYCTNVHANANLQRTRENLAAYALAVKASFSPREPMGIGLWLSAQAANELIAAGGVAEFAEWLSEVGLVPFTFNGFPFGDFHQPVVKHRVYQPTWFEPERLDYTLKLIQIMDGLLPAGQEGSISTLPISWPEPRLTDQQWATAAVQLVRVADKLAQLERETGRRIHVCLEPEPGCVLQRSHDMVDLFENHLLRQPGVNEDVVRRHLRVCHDICHAVVMFESQASVWQTYRDAGIRVGKVQVSSAICVRFDEIEPKDREQALLQLASFAEDRYLHQTMVRSAPDADPQFYEDLPLALRAFAGQTPGRGEWRVHFHVPIYLDAFGYLHASKDAIGECLRAARSSPDVTHFEVETYAWGVLPDELQVPHLADGIAREMQWFRDQLG